MQLITMCTITIALRRHIVSEPVLESMKHCNTEMNELKTLPEVTMWSFICLGYSFCGIPSVSRTCLYKN